MNYSDDSKLWFASDFHFFHNNICEYSGRPWTQAENTERLIERWNSRVGEMDHVFHLGDFAFASHKKFPQVVEIIKELNGLITFIGGNHCDRRLWRMIEDAQIAHVVGIDNYKEIRVGENRRKVCMFHYPMETWNGAHHGAYHLHGHCHGSLPAKGKRLDVGIDNHPDFQVFSWAEVKAHMDNQEIVIVDHHTGERP